MTRPRRRLRWTALARGPFALVIFGAGHDLTAGVRRVAGAGCEYVRVAVAGFPE